VNEILNDSKQHQLRVLLASIECRLSILKINNQTVHSNYAVVGITNLESNILHITTPLRLPADSQVTYLFEMVFSTRTITFTSHKIERRKEESPYHYTVEYDSNRFERTVMYSMINQMMESAPSATSRAIASYVSLYSYDQFIPKNVFQT
jgi:hypothetical protein